jgi:TolB-like protein/predicted nucleic acid-binding protein
MRCLAEAGDTAGALRAYEALYALLDEEFDTEPTSATQRLVAEIKLGRLEPAPPPPPAAPAQPDGAGPIPGTSMSEPAARIALLVEPFQVNGVPPDEQHLTQGFRHDLMASLVRFREWFVVDGVALPPPEQTGQRVSARYRIRTTAYKAGSGIQVNLILAEESGFWIWTESTSLTLDGWYEMQQRIVRRIAVSLNLQISTARLSGLSAEPDRMLDTFDRWLRAQALILKFNRDDWQRAGQLFQECVERNPEFSPPYSGLVQMDNAVHIVHPGARRDRDRALAALDRARRAVVLDPMDSRAQLCLGWSQAMLGRHALAEVPMQLACDLNPYDSWTLTSSALFHSFRGQHSQAAALWTKAMDSVLVPSATQWAYQVSIAYLAGDDRGALEALELAQDAIHTMPAWRASVLARLGRRAEATQAAQRFLRNIRTQWQGQQPPTDEEIVGWLLHLYPFQHEREWLRLREGLALAGLPVTGARFGEF